MVHDPECADRIAERLSELRDLVRQCISEQSCGFDVLASHSWDQVCEWMEGVPVRTRKDARIAELEAELAKVATSHQEVDQQASDDSRRMEWLQDGGFPKIASTTRSGDLRATIDAAMQLEADDAD